MQKHEHDKLPSEYLKKQKTNWVITDRVMVIVMMMLSGCRGCRENENKQTL